MQTTTVKSFCNTYVHHDENNNAIGHTDPNPFSPKEYLHFDMSGKLVGYIGVFQTLGNSKYVLTELYSDTKPSEALLIIKTLKEHGYQPVIAHMERNYNITGRMVGLLIAAGALIQVNAISFVDEIDSEIKVRARELLRNRYIHFIGSDAHRINHRPPCLKSGVQYIIDNTDEEYAVSILNGNAQRILI